ncbi:zinc finger protein 488 [Candoia aspera]|uniref:zinc finger protein 488 n=1 Tax=Candoia aspera TaxID=51853 RepID=UPI002FD84EDB
MMKGKFMKQSTHFHSLPQDSQFKIVTYKDSNEGRRMNRDEMESDKNRKPVLFEKTNCLHEYSGVKDGRTVEHLLRESFWKFSTRKQFLVKDVLQQKESAFTEVRSVEKLNTEKAKEAEQGNRKAYSDKARAQCSPGSAFSFVWPNSVAEEPKSAFRKPAKCWEDGGAPVAFQPLKGAMASPRKLSECISATDLMQCSGRLTSKFLVSDSNGFQLLSTNLIQSNPFTYSSAPWPNETGEQMQAMPVSTSSSSSASLALLPPTFTSFGIAAQNWCAKCSLSFRMTSDLVLHMRSHHKKVDVSTESQRKRRREEKLTCPVCQEYFRERHHLSRHMTSHN